MTSRLPSMPRSSKAKGGTRSTRDRDGLFRLECNDDLRLDRLRATLTVLPTGPKEPSGFPVEEDMPRSNAQAGKGIGTRRWMVNVLYIEHGIHGSPAGELKSREQERESVSGAISGACGGGGPRRKNPFPPLPVKNNPVYIYK